MTREYDIKNAAWDYFQDLDRHYFEPTPYCNPHIDAFEAGAKWADEHPKKGLVRLDKVCKYLEMRLDEYIIRDLKRAMEE